MRWRQVVFLYAVLAGLAVAWWAGERPAPPPSDEPPSRERFLPLGDAAIEEVTLRRGSRTVRAQRDGDRWTVVEPPDAAVPSDLLSAFADALADAETIAEVGDRPGDIRAFGLDESAGRVELRAHGRPPIVVRLGGTNPTGTAVYAQREGTPAVFLIGRNVAYYAGLILEALPPGRVPVEDDGAPIGG